MAVTAKLVKELREKTGAGMMDCKKALEECAGDLEKAFDWLREKGIAKAAKKADRIAAEGLTAFYVEGNRAAIVEVNSETDFVAKNQEFKDLVSDIAKCVCINKPTTMEEALACDLNGKSIENTVVDATAKIGEKLSFRRFDVIEKAENQAFGAYSHMGGKISALVLLTDTTDEVARDIAMHVAASAPQYVDRSQIPAEVLEREHEVLKQQALEENKNAAKPKPEQIIVKMVEGRLTKEMKEICLMDQAYFKNDELTVAKYLKEVSKEVGFTVDVKSYIRYETGEGIEKKEENFAEEVAKQMGQ